VIFIYNDIGLLKEVS